MSFLVLGDAGTRGSTQQRVASAAAQVADAVNPSFIAYIGDNIYGDGAEGDPQLLADWWRDVYLPHSSLRRPWHPVTGNHDWHTDARTERDFTTHPLNEGGWWRMPSFWYKQSFATPSLAIDVFFIDTQIWKGSGLAEELLGGNIYHEQVSWLTSELSASLADWKVVLGHHPVYSAGSHGTTEDLLLELDPILRQFGVHAYFNGHDHNLQLIQYRGMNYVTSGAAGKSSSSRSNEEPSGSLSYIFQDSGFVSMHFCDAASSVLTFYDEYGNTQAEERLPAGAPQRSLSTSSAALVQRRPQTTSAPQCNGAVLRDVDKVCSTDGCTVIADQLTSKTCSEYCEAQGLACINGWNEDYDEDCRRGRELGCAESQRSVNNNICSCA
jgi:acid phosphatase